MAEADTGGRAKRSWIGDFGAIAVIVGLLFAIYLLPPDTSLAEVQKAGYVRACVPPEYPPLATRGDTERPGFEVELLQAVAERMGVRLLLGINTSIGRDPNPRSWQLTRATCQIVAGGIVDNSTIRSFMDTTPPHLETGWVVVSPGEMPESLEGLRVGVYVGMAGRDRIALSRVLREAGATISLVTSAPDLVRGLSGGTLDVGVTESLIGGQTALQNQWEVAWLASDQREPLAFGLWKGDLTLKRAVRQAVNELIAEGFVDRLTERYNILQPDITILGQTVEADEDAA